MVLHNRHKKLFNNVVLPTLEANLSSTDFEFTKGRTAGFAAGLGSVLIFEDQDVLENLKKERPMANSIMGEYLESSSGMLQFTSTFFVLVFQLGFSSFHLSGLALSRDPVR